MKKYSVSVSERNEVQMEGLKEKRLERAHKTQIFRSAIQKKAKENESRSAKSIEYARHAIAR